MKTESNFLTKLFIATFLATGAISAVAQRVPGSINADLFAGATAADQRSVKTAVDSDILKRRLVRVNFSDLNKQTRVGGKLQINLFDDLSLAGTVDQVEERAAKNYSLSGHLDNDASSTFAVSVFNDVVAMNVRTTNGKLYQLRYIQGDLHEVREVNESKYPACGVKAEHAVAFPAMAADAPAQAQGDTAEFIDVMMIYTSAARTAIGSSNAIHAEINLAISGANTAYQESQITTRLRLVYAGEVTNYTETGFSAALGHITNPSDGVLDQIQGLRNTYGADLVSLWINDSSSCGLAWLMTTLTTNFATSGFSVVHWDCAVGNFSFAHELAHNMGCTHNREDSGGAGLYPYSYGWRFTGTNGFNYRTIMAYNGSPSSTRIGRFSNPSVNYFGTPTGVAVGLANESHNAQTINNVALTVANFRQASVGTNTPPSIITHPQPQSVPIGATATFNVSASGTPPLFYFWKRATTNIPGATASSYSITNVQISDTNIYSVIVSNAFGNVPSSNAALTISSNITIGVAVDNTGFTWLTGSSNFWTGQTVTTHDGIDAAQSAPITHNQNSIFQTTIVGPGTLSFWWKVSSEPGYDYLDVFLDGAFLDPLGISGEVNWTPRTFSIPAGSHTLIFQYFKDISDTFGQDKGWVDQISYTGGSSFSPGSLVMTNGQFRFTFNGLGGAAYSVQASSNLTSWATITNVLSTNTSHLYLDTSTTNRPMRFYRVTSP